MFRYEFLRNQLTLVCFANSTQAWYWCCVFFFWQWGFSISSQKSKALLFAACLVLSHFAIISGVNSSTNISKLMARLAGLYPQYLGSTHNSRCRKCTSSNCNSSCVLAVFIAEMLIRLRIAWIFLIGGKAYGSSVLNFLASQETSKNPSLHFTA